MKTKLLLVSALFALTITGCGKKNNPEPQPEPEPEPEEKVVDVENEEQRSALENALYKAYLNYSDPANFNAVNVNAEVKDFNLDLGVDITEKSEYGRNQLDFSLSNCNANIDAYARKDANNVIEGMVKATNVSGKVAIDAGILQPLPEDPAPVAPANSLRDTEPEPQPEPEGFFASGEFEVAPLALDAYFKDGNIYVDYSDEGVRTTLTNAGELAYQLYEAGMGAYAQIKAAREAAKEAANQPKSITRDVEPEPVPALDLNAMIDEFTAAPDRKVYVTAEEEGFVLDEEDTVPPTAEEKAEAQEKIGEFANETLPKLVMAKIIGMKVRKNGSYEFSVSLNKAKVSFLLGVIEQLEAAEKAKEEQANPTTASTSETSSTEPEEPSYAEIFDQYCEKFDLDAKVVLDANGFVRSLAVSYDIKAGVEEMPYTFFNLNGEATIALALSGKISASFKYNDEVAFQLPEDLNTYVYIGAE